jgi:heptosyltransferase I
LRTQEQFRLLVVRLGAMGDVLHALPAVTALRLAHPHWRIDWAIEPKWRPLLATDLADTQPGIVPVDEHLGQRPVVDRIILAPTKAWGKRPLSRETRMGIGALRAELRAAEYDAVLDLQGAIRSSVLARLTGCRRVIGDAEPWEKPARLLYTERVATVGPHVIERNVELANAVAGDELEPEQPRLPVDEAAELWCDEIDELKIGAAEGRPVVLLHPGGGWGAKRWPADRYGIVAEQLSRRGALVLVHAGSGDEEVLARVAVATAHGRAGVVSCSLAQLVALTRRVALVIGGDTGPLHLACALGKPVVGLYGPTDPKRNGPFGCRSRVLRNAESRTDHTRREQPEAGLLTILPEAVMESVASLFLEEQREAPVEEEWL